jgi:hypothetical protein
MFAFLLSIITIHTLHHPSPAPYPILVFSWSDAINGHIRRFEAILFTKQRSEKKRGKVGDKGREKRESKRRKEEKRGGGGEGEEETVDE